MNWGGGGGGGGATYPCAVIGLVGEGRARATAWIRGNWRELGQGLVRATARTGLVRAKARVRASGEG